MSDHAKHQRVILKGQPLFPQRYYGGKDLRGNPRNAIIAKVVKEKMYSRDAHAVVEKWVIYLRGEDPKRMIPFVMGIELSESIAVALDEWNAEKWIDRKVCIYPRDTPVGVAVLARAAKNGTDALPHDPTEEADAGQFVPSDPADKTDIDRIWDVLTFYEVEDPGMVFEKAIAAAKGDAGVALGAIEKRFGKVPVV